MYSKLTTKEHKPKVTQGLRDEGHFGFLWAWAPFDLVLAIAFGVTQVASRSRVGLSAA